MKLKKVIKRILKKLIPISIADQGSQKKLEKIMNQCHQIMNQCDDMHKKITWMWNNEGAGLALNSGERQVFDDIESFREDHKQGNRIKIGHIIRL